MPASIEALPLVTGTSGVAMHFSYFLSAWHRVRLQYITLVTSSLPQLEYMLHDADISSHSLPGFITGPW